MEEGGWASELLASRAAQLDPRDRGLASEIVLGSLRHQRQLDFLIGKFGGRDAAKLDLPIRAALRIGVYQIWFLDRIPAHAAVNDSVELVRRSRGSGLVNAILRRVKRADVGWPSPAVEYNLPDWLWGRWNKRFGPDATMAMARAFLSPPEMFVRVPPGAEPGGAIPTDVAGCFRVMESGPGRFRRQDIGAQCVVPLLELQPGMHLLDLCAAPGNKTAQALESGVRVTACDLHWARLKANDLTCDRVVLDATKPLPFGIQFDRVLIDAPCTGTGTLGRNPEIRWRIQPEDPGRLAQVQVKIVMAGLSVLKRGGRLVYSTCSMEQEENEKVIETVLGANPGLEQLASMRRMPGGDPGDGFYAAVLT